MKIDKAFLEVILSERYGILENLRKNAKDALKDKNGNSSTPLANSLRFIGVTEYLLSNDIVSFKANLSDSVKLYLNLLKRYTIGEPIAESYVTMLCYKNLFDALAVGDFDLAKEFASLMGGRDEIEKRNDHPFDYAFGYTLKAFVLNNRHDMERYGREFSEVCSGGGNYDFAGYAEMFHAILDNNSVAANQAVKSIVKGHIKQTKGRGVFKYTDDEHLCIWGIGIVNLARSFGLDVSASLPWIPSDLLGLIGPGLEREMRGRP